MLPWYTLEIRDSPSFIIHSIFHTTHENHERPTGKLTRNVMMKQKEFYVVKDSRVTCEKDHHQEISKQKTREEKLFDIKSQFLWVFS